MIYAATTVLSLLGQTSTWALWFGADRSWAVQFFGERLRVVLLALNLAATLTLLGHKRRDYFFALGNVSAPAPGTRWPATLIQLLGLSVAITWLYVNTQGSLVIASLYHAAQSFFVIVNEGIIGPQQAWLLAIGTITLGLILIFLVGPALSRSRSERPIRKAVPHFHDGSL